MRVLVIQNKVYEKINDTLEDIKVLISKRENFDFDLLVLPEMFMCPYQIDLFKEYAQNESSLVHEFLKSLALKHQAYIIGGSIPETNNNKIYNTSYVYNSKGLVIHKYRKIHLFSITYPDNTTFNESDSLAAGNKLGVFSSEFGNLGIMICFDIRYPLLAEKIANEDVKAIFVPGAFNDYTGPLHWQTTFKARAIDNQLFMIGCSPSADSYGSYKTYGHSLIIDPLGQVIKELDGVKGIIEYELNFNEIKEIREKLPIRKNKKDLTNIL